MAPKTKKCSKCGNMKMLTSFYKNKSTNDGLNYQCKHCVEEDRLSRIEKKKKMKEKKEEDLCGKEITKEDLEKMVNEEPEKDSKKVEIPDDNKTDIDSEEENEGEIKIVTEYFKNGQMIKRKTKFFF